jgi:hypothetical protein
MRSSTPLRLAPALALFSLCAGCAEEPLPPAAAPVAAPVVEVDITMPAKAAIRRLGNRQFPLDSCTASIARLSPSVEVADASIRTGEPCTVHVVRRSDATFVVVIHSASSGSNRTAHVIVEANGNTVQRVNVHR